MTTEALEGLRFNLEHALSKRRVLPERAWIFGAGGFGRALRRALEAAGVRIVGYLTTADDGEADGLPVRSVNTGPEGTDAVVIGVFNHRADSDYSALSKLLQEAGFSEPWWPQEIYGLLADSLGWQYWLASRSLYLDHWDAIAEAYTILGDTTSRQQLLRLLEFRLLAFDQPPQPCGEPQYFPELLVSRLPPRVVWADGGAFDGDSLIASEAHFCTELCFAFEPEPAVYSTLLANTRAVKSPVIRLPLGLSDRNATLAFQTGAHGAGAVSPDGNAHLSFVRLDDLLHERPIDLLKLDVEGQETAALRGAEAMIRSTRPRLAIAAYHRWNDIPDLIRLLRAFRDDYQFHLRVHEHNGFDTVLYAV